MSTRTPVVDLALRSLLLVAVCIPAGMPASSVAQSIPASAGPAAAPAFSDSPGPSALAMDVQAIAGAVFAQVARAPDVLIAEVRAAELERSGLAAVDPGLPATLNEFQSRADEAFATYLAEASPVLEPLPDASPGPSTSAAASSPHGPLIASLAMTRPALPAAERRFDQGGAYLSSLGAVLGFAKSQIGAFRPSKQHQGGRSPVHENGGSRYRIDMVADRDTITLLIEHTEQYSVPGSTQGSAAYSVTDSGSTTLQVDACPDEDGTIVVVANASGTYDVAGGGLTYHASLDTHDRATVTVDDAAQVADRSHALSVRGSAAGDRPGFAGGAGAVDSQLDARLSWSGATGGGPAPDVALVTAEGVSAQDVRSAFTGGAFTAALVDAAIDAASTVWRGTHCLELRVEPAGKTVEPGSRTGIKVTIEHKAFDEEVARDVRATLEGAKDIDPSDQPVRAPDEFTFIAPDEQGGAGVITFRSVSNRGIAERTETYRVDLSLLLDVDGKVTYRVPGVTASGTIKGRGLVVRLITGDDPEATPGVTVTGDLQVQMRSTTPGCSGNGGRRYAVDSGLDASAKVVGQGEDRQLSVLIRPAQPSAQLSIRVQCSGQGVTMKLPLDLLFPHFERGGEVLLPLAGGQVTRRGTVRGVQSRFTFTLRREQSPRR